MIDLTDCWQHSAHIRNYVSICGIYFQR